eukprot:scaffold393634_cov19-Prasinocladus_malaysianus.AAC.2
MICNVGHSERGVQLCKAPRSGTTNFDVLSSDCDRSDSGKRFGYRYEHGMTLHIKTYRSTSTGTGGSHYEFVYSYEFFDYPCITVRVPYAPATLFFTRTRTYRMSFALHE